MRKSLLVNLLIDLEGFEKHGEDRQVTHVFSLDLDFTEKVAAEGLVPDNRLCEMIHGWKR
ncbi:MAG TPA: hypothetical protein DCR17_11940 [Verrucomicrobiales bacterium]|nr:hypothetical protein [Pedosphaera sp.]MBL6845032.1 hypothetical protein [Verrucomicrobiae bacterium]HAO67385.1 hypothetical protein [Verrucomicrobiales bacterium]MAH95661.1 hypothetical protein [Pedosphaera sp.]HAQ99171.1 hypothetical protein [Verrucomicrobiales bacterium]